MRRTSCKRFWVVVASACALLTTLRGALADEVWQALGSGMNLDVSALTVYNGELIAGGSFTTAGGVAANRIARWNGTVWQPLGSGMPTNSVVFALTVYNGELIAGGYWSSPGGLVAQIARWNGSSWQPLGDGVGGTPISQLKVSALCVYDGELIVGGDFSTAGGITANRIARWNGSTWQPLGSGMNFEVRALTVHNGELIAGGAFTTAGGVAANRIARWNGSSWQPMGGGGGGVSALAVYNGQLFAAGPGSFPTDGPTANRIARWDGTAWQPLGSGSNNGVNDSVYALTVFDGELIVGGEFTAAGGFVTRSIARWNGTAWQPPPNAGMDDSVRALMVYNGELIAGGDFDSAGGQTVHRIARTSASSSGPCESWQSLGIGMNGTTYALTVYQNELIAGGQFSSAGGITVGLIARWNGAAWQPLASSGMNGTIVYALTEYNGELVAGGDFTTAGGVAANRIARWNGSVWQSLGTGMDGAVKVLFVYNGELIAGGPFTTAGGVTVNRIARWNGASWQDLSGGMSTGASDEVRSLTAYSGELIAGGMFTAAGGVAASRIARWNGISWQSLGSGMDGFGAVWALTVYNGELIAGGSFHSAGGVTALDIARWNGVVWSPVGMGVSNDVYDLDVYNGELIVGGFFTTAGSVVVNNLARWNGSSWRAFASGMGSHVSALGLFDDQLIAAGGFTAPTSYIARWSPNYWFQASSGSFSNDINWELPFSSDSPALFGTNQSSTPFTVNFRGPAESTSLCISNQQPIFDLNGNTYVIDEYTTIGASQTVSLTINNGTLISPRIDVGSFGTLGGDGTIIGNVDSVGCVRPGDLGSTRAGRGAGGAALTMQGNYAQDASASLISEIHSELAGSLIVNGEASLAGTLVITIPTGELPDGGFTVLDAATLNPVRNRFGLAYATGLPQGKLAIVEYPGERGPGDVNVTIVAFDDTLNLNDPTNSSVDGIASSAVLADFNGDLYLDIAVTLPALDGVGILLNEGGAGDTYTQLPLVSVGDAPADLVAAMLNADAAIDLAVANEGSGSVSVLVNDDTGNFSVSQTINGVGDAPVAITAADFDAANGVDLAIANRDGNNVRLLDNNGSGTFAAGLSLFVGTEPLDVVAVDLTDNGTPDLIVANGASNNVMLLFNDGARSFATNQTIDVGQRPIRINPEDLDNDKDVDVVVMNSNSLNLSLIVNAGGSYSASVPVPTNGAPLWLTTGDVDSDGDADVAVVIDHAIDGQIVQILRNDSTAAGQSQVTFTLLPDSIGEGASPLIVLSGDVNNDLRDDLITINGDPSPLALGGGRSTPLGSVRVQLSTEPVNLCPADIAPAGGDKQVTIADITFVLTAFGLPCNDCPQDIVPQPDGDDQVTIADITFVLTAFGPCGG